MPFVFSHVENCDMHFVYGFCDGTARAAVDEYWRHFSDRRIPSRGVFSLIHQTMRETSCLPSVAVQSEREVVPLTNTRENILEMVQRSPRLSTQNCLSRRCVTYTGVANSTRGRFTSISWSQGTSGMRGPCSTYRFVPLDNSTSRTVKHHFVHRWGVFYPGQYK